MKWAKGVEITAVVKAEVQRAIRRGIQSRDQLRNGR